MVHGTSEVSIRGDMPNGLGDEAAEAKLKESCATCPMRKTVSKGDAFRRDVIKKYFKTRVMKMY